MNEPSKPINAVPCKKRPNPLALDFTAYSATEALQRSGAEATPVGRESQRSSMGLFRVWPKMWIVRMTMIGG